MTESSWLLVNTETDETERGVRYYIVLKWPGNLRAILETLAIFFKFHILPPSYFPFLTFDFKDIYISDQEEGDL